jgi:hypothetical protein
MSAFFAPRGDVFFCFSTSKAVVSKAFSSNNKSESREEMDLAALTTRGKAVSTVGGGVWDTIDTLGATSHLLGSLLVESVDTVLDIVVDDGLGGRVDSIGLDGTVAGEASVAGVDESLETLTLAGVRLHDLLVLLKSGVHLAGLNIVEEDAGAEGAGNSSTELAITGLEETVSWLKFCWI